MSPLLYTPHVHSPGRDGPIIGGTAFILLKVGRLHITGLRVESNPPVSEDRIVSVSFHNNLVATLLRIAPFNGPGAVYDTAKHPARK